MAEDRAAKLRLKRRKAGPPRGPPEEPLVASTCWFEGNGLNELDDVWRLVLNAAYPDLKSQNWETMPSLPAFLEKCSEKDKKAMNTEVFHVGPKEFEWTPFPSVTSEETVNSIDSDLQKMISSTADHQETDVLHQKQIRVSSGSSKPTMHNAMEKMRAEHNTQSAHKIFKKENTEMPKRSRLKNPTQQSQRRGNTRISVDIHGPPNAAPQSLTKTSGFERLFKTSSQDENKKIEGESSKAKQPEISIVCGDISVEEVEQCSSDIPPEFINEGTSSLQSCPMCSLQFAERSTPLDIDSHLAKCLSETTEDIMW